MPHALPVRNVSRFVANLSPAGITSLQFVTAGMVVLTLTLILFSRMDENTTFWGLLPAMLLGGVGMSAAMAPTTAAAMQSVSPDKAGVGSAVLNSARQVGGSCRTLTCRC